MKASSITGPSVVVDAVGFVVIAVLNKGPPHVHINN
jgi:hypothetical protein